MTTIDSVLDRVPVDRITAEAREVHFTRTLLAVLAGFFWLIGWSIGKAFTVAWFVAAWVATAVRIGWSDARPAPPAAHRS